MVGAKQKRQNPREQHLPRFRPLSYIYVGYIQIYSKWYISLVVCRRRTPIERDERVTHPLVHSLHPLSTSSSIALFFFHCSYSHIGLLLFILIHSTFNYFHRDIVSRNAIFLLPHLATESSCKLGSLGSLFHLASFSLSLARRLSMK